MKTIANHVSAGILTALLPIVGTSQSAHAANLLINGDFSNPALAPGTYITDAAINAYNWLNGGGPGVADNYISRFGVGGKTDNYALLGGASKGAALGLTQSGVAAVSSTTQTTRYTFSVDIWGSYEGGANGVYGGNLIIVEYSGGGLGVDGSNFIYVASANKVGNDGTGNVLIAKSNDNFNLISNLKNESVTGVSPQSNFADTFVNNQWNTLRLSWDLAANSVLNESSTIKVYLLRPTGNDWEGSNNWTAYDNATLTASIYGPWAATNAGGQVANLDYDNDGVSNGVEFFMNAPAGFTANPGLDGSNKVTWTNGGNIPSTGYGTQFVVQVSTDLVTWDDVTEGDMDQNGTNTASSLSYTLAGTGKQFVRLKVTPN
jgi:hypothetical protein